LVLLLRAIYARYRSKIHLSQLFRFPEPLLTAMELQTELERIKPDTRFVLRVIDVSKPHD
jgi:hypothetical protein